MTKKAIRVENISKKYNLGVVGSSNLRETLTNSFQLFNPFKQKKQLDSFWALNNVSFDVDQGEVIGIIGRNGAGKSTLLKILSKITEPTSGRITLNGRIASLLEVGTGFHPELTGRENIFLNGSILGMTRQEIRSKFDEIVDFSGVEKFLDTPVKRYSSGMYVRLAFAVAAHLEPEILVIDEVLAVGDVEFQKKCLGKMGEVAKGGRTVLFVSHNMGAVKELCNRAILLDKGECVMNGEVPTIIDAYLQKRKKDADLKIADRKDRKGQGDVIVTDVRFFDSQNNSQTDTVVCGSDLRIEIDYTSRKKTFKNLSRLEIGLSVFNNQTQFCTVLNNKRANFPFNNVSPSGTVSCFIPQLPLMAGRFYFRVALVADGLMNDIVEDACFLNVLPYDYYNAGYSTLDTRQGVYINQEWQVKNH